MFDVPVIRIGAGDGNELRLTDSAVSGKHCELRRTPAGPLLRDLGSTNGIRIGGNKVREIYVHHPTRFRVGRTEIEVVPIDEVHEIAPSEADRFESLVGGSQAMRELYSVLARLAPTELSVLVHGETGTGKELVSRALHARSNRREGPMVVFDAAAVPHELIARELFGHVKGAFTGADADSPGLFEKADGGTLFLDEIGELPLDLQPHLLRALEQRAIRRVGDTRYRPVDVRIVAATNRDLAVEVQEGRFRADLYYRLATVEVVVPALRDRLDDLDRLVATFLEQAGVGHGVVGLSPGAGRATCASSATSCSAPCRSPMGRWCRCRRCPTRSPGRRRPPSRAASTRASSPAPTTKPARRCSTPLNSSTLRTWFEGPTGTSRRLRASGASTARRCTGSSGATG